MLESIKENAGHRATKDDWKGLMRTLPDDQSGTYNQALQLLNSIQASPSCNRLAASTLLESCQTVDGSRPDVEESLENIKSIYAARLALCEISSTGLLIPPDCKHLMPVDALEGKGSLEWILGSGRAKSAPYSNIGNRQFSQCLQSLESRPQWWTSYSNSRQNAAIMCQVARVDIERGEVDMSIWILPETHGISDEFIKLHKSMAETSSNINNALSKALENAAIQLSEQKEFAVTVKVFQRQMLQDLDASTSQAQSYFAKLMKGMETAMQLMLNTWKSGAKDVSTELDELQNVSTISNSMSARPS
jgi:hypothetical protein